MTIHNPIWLEGVRTLDDPARLRAANPSSLGMTLEAAAALCLGLLSALLIGWATNSRAASAVFGAIVLAALGYVLARSRRASVDSVAGIDWSLVRAALEVVSECVAVTNAEGRVISANSAWAERGHRLGGTPELNMLQDTGMLAALLEEASRAGVAKRDSVACHEGEHACSLVVRQVGGTPPFYIWTLSDPPEVRIRATAVGDISGQIGQWMSNAGMMAAVVDGDGRILAANEALERAAGQGGISGMPLSQLVRASETGEVSFVQPDGVARRLNLIELALGDGVAADTYVFLLLEETPRHDGEDWPLGEGRLSIEALLSTLPLGMALADRDGRFRFLNEAFHRAAQIDPESEPLYPSDLVIEDDKAMVADMLRRVATGHLSPRDLRVRLRHAPDEPVVLTIAGFTGIGHSAVVLFLKDNSEQEKLERQVAQATKMQAVGQLAGGVAHDFNNILTAVIGYCDLMLLRHSPGDSDFDDITQIKQNANRAANLVRQLLAFSRQQTLRLQVLQLSDVVGELSHLLKRLLGETITLTVNYGRNLGAVRADPGQLEQVIVNLAVNARDAMPEGGELTIETYAVSTAESRKLGSDVLPPAEYTALRVSDTGSGIPHELLGKIFEPFFTTKEVGKGTGLGLSTVYGIVKQTGGYIFAESQPGTGTSFLIYLPVHTAEQARPQIPVRPKAQGNDLWGVGTVLLVEDEATVRAVAERALSRKGYHVLTAEHGEDAMEILNNTAEIDLLISDVVMPVMDGPTLVALARAQRPDLPIVFMSGYAEEQLRRSIEIPDFAFLPKPFSVQQLAEAVSEALQNARK